MPEAVSERPDYETIANLLISLSMTVEGEYGHGSDLIEAREQAKRLYETHGPMELEFGYYFPEPEWYDDA